MAGDTEDYKKIACSERSHEEHVQARVCASRGMYPNLKSKPALSIHQQDNFDLVFPVYQRWQGNAWERACVDLFLDLEAGTLDLSLQHNAALALSFLHFWYEIVLVSELGRWDAGLVTPAFWTCLLQAGEKKLCLSLELEAGALDLSFQHWTCLFEAGPKAQRHFSYKRVFVSGAGRCDVRLVTPALDLSPASWACGPAPVLIRNYVCFWIWELGHWTCHLSIGLVFWELGLWRSFILNKKLCLFLDLDTRTSDLSLQHWTCLLDAGPRKLCLLLDLKAGALDLSFQHWIRLFEAGAKAQLRFNKNIFVSGLGSCDVGPVTPALDSSFASWACTPAPFLMRNYVCFWIWKLGQALDLSFGSWAFGHS